MRRLEMSFYSYYSPEKFGKLLRIYPVVPVDRFIFCLEDTPDNPSGIHAFLTTYLQENKPVSSEALARLLEACEQQPKSIHMDRIKLFTNQLLHLAKKERLFLKISKY